jgi:hypothetical protein
VKSENHSQVDYELFDSTYSVDMPLCSARDLNETISSTADDDALKQIENVTLRNLYNGDSNFVK